MRNYLILLIFILSLGACKKSGNATPQDAFTCSINGAAFSASNSAGINMTAEMIDSNYYLDLNATDGNHKIEIVLYDPARISNKTYSITDTFGTQRTCTAKYTDITKDPAHGYSTGNSYTGSVILSVDKSGQRVSGSFSFQAKFQTSTETVSVTNGNFSLPCIIN